MLSVEDIGTYVVNLKRRPDRRERMTGLLPTEFKAVFTSDWDGPFDGHEIDVVTLQRRGFRLHDWPIESNNPWWSRPLKLGEVGCALSHLACWQHAVSTDRSVFVFLEDDVTLAPSFTDLLLHGLREIAQYRQFQLVYLGRFPLEPDREPVSPGFVVPGYAHCTFGYVLTRQAVTAVLDARLGRAIIPIDEFLPTMYIDHPRPDIRVRFPKRLTALAFEPPIVRQLPKTEAGSDTENSAFVQ